jgi:hypothetical protein
LWSIDEVKESQMQVINPMQIAKLSQVPKHLSIATTEQELRDIWHLRHAQYSPLYPDVKDFENDKYDQFACVFYSRNNEGEIISTGRIAFDGPIGLPADSLIKPEIDKLREKGLRLAESSKLAINRTAKGILPYYFYTYYELSAAYNIDSIVFIIRDRYIGAYTKSTGARIIVDDIGYTYGTNYKFSLLEWRIKEMGEIFLKNWEGKLL